MAFGNGFGYGGLGGFNYYGPYGPYGGFSGLNGVNPVHAPVGSEGPGAAEAHEPEKGKGIGGFFRGLANGAVNTVKSLFTLQGLLTAAGTGALVWATGGAALIPLAALGTGIGGYQMIKGVAQNNTEALGEGVFTTALSLGGLRFTPKEVGLNGKPFNLRGASDEPLGLAGRIKALWGGKTYRSADGEELNIYQMGLEKLKTRFSPNLGRSADGFLATNPQTWTRRAHVEELRNNARTIDGQALDHAYTTAHENLYLAEARVNRLKNGYSDLNGDQILGLRQMEEMQAGLKQQIQQQSSPELVNALKHNQQILSQQRAELAKAQSGLNEHKAHLLHLENQAKLPNIKDVEAYLKVDDDLLGQINRLKGDRFADIFQTKAQKEQMTHQIRILEARRQAELQQFQQKVQDKMDLRQIHQQSVQSQYAQTIPAQEFGPQSPSEGQAQGTSGQNAGQRADVPTAWQRAQSWWQGVRQWFSGRPSGTPAGQQAPLTEDNLSVHNSETGSTGSTGAPGAGSSRAASVAGGESVSSGDSFGTAQSGSSGESFHSAQRGSTS